MGRFVFKCKRKFDSNLCKLYNPKIINRELGVIDGGIPMLKAVFKFIAEAREEKLKAQTDYYANKSKELDALSKNDIRSKIQREKLVQLKEVDKIIKSLSHRTSFRCTPIDYKLHIQPIFNDITNCIKKHAIDCHVKPYENIMDGYVKVGDLIDLIDDNHFVPDKTGIDSAKSIESIPVLEEPEYSKGKLGEFQKYMHKNYPLATASAKVRYEEHETDTDLNLKRPLIISLLYSEDGHDTVRNDSIPLYADTELERSEYDEARSRKHSYRGHKY